MLQMDCPEERDECGCVNRCAFCTFGFPPKASTWQKQRHTIDECQEFWDYAHKKGLISDEEYFQAMENMIAIANGEDAFNLPSIRGYL